MSATKTLVLFVYILLIAVINLGTAKISYAQSQSIEVTSVFEIADSEAQEGDILISTPDGLVRSTAGYDSRIFGVIQATPLVVFRDNSIQGQPVIRSGTALVNVTTLNGPIQYGDYITSSSISGKGAKGSESGYVLGIALESFDGQGSETTSYEGQEVSLGTIPVAIRIEYAESSSPRSFNRMFDFLGNLFLKTGDDPDQLGKVFRYLSAGLIVVLTFAFGFITFSRSVTKSVEAIGRNPLAKNTIQVSMVLNAGLSIVTAIIGVAAAIFILKV